jgi:flagellar M-ring protein FliF
MNENLRKLAHQISETWKQLGLNQRVSLVLGSGVVLAGLIGLSLWSSRPDFVLLYGRLDASEAAAVMAALDEEKIPYQTGRAGSSVLVPSDQVYKVRAQLASKGIPRGDGVGFEIFDKPNFGISDFVQRANYLRAVQGELARTISQIDMVESARVMIVMPENRLLVDAQKKPTASVFVRTRGQGLLPSSAVSAIRLVVANGVEGLKADSVSVVDNLGNVLSANGENDSVAGVSNSRLTARRDLEKYLSRKAEEILEKALGPGQAIVRVAAEINWDTITRLEETFDPDGQVARTTLLDDEVTTTSTADTSGGAAGIASNTVNADTNSASGGALNTSQTKKKTANNEYEINKTTSNILLSGGGIKRLSAAVFVAEKVEEENGERTSVPRSDEEIQKIQRIVQSALGIVEDDPERKDTITVEQLPFNEQSASELTRQLEKDGKRLFYWEIGKNVLYALVALVIFIVFLKLLKKTAPDDLPIGIPAGTANGADGSPNAGEGMAGIDWRREAKPGVVSVDVLNALIKENPANMTQAVRSWLTGTNKSN